MSEPIVTRELRPRLNMQVRCECSYDQLLELFPDDGNLVKPLVNRCMRYEAALAGQDKLIERLIAENQRLRDEVNMLLNEAELVDPEREVSDE